MTSRPHHQRLAFDLNSMRFISYPGYVHGNSTRMSLIYNGVDVDSKLQELDSMIGNLAQMSLESCDEWEYKPLQDTISCLIIKKNLFLHQVMRCLSQFWMGIGEMGRRLQCPGCGKPYYLTLKIHENDACRYTNPAS